MIRWLACIFWVAWLTGISFGQKNHVFTSIEETKAVHPDSVYYLDLRGQKLKSVPIEVNQFNNLKDLNLSKNKLTQLPNDLNLPHLEILNLEKNKFEIFPSVICNQLALTQLYLGRNEIAELPGCIGDLKEMVILDVWLNVLVDLPDELMLLEKLELLDLRGMNFSDKFQGGWNNRLPWAKIEFDNSCDCAH